MHGECLPLFPFYHTMECDGFTVVEVMLLWYNLFKGKEGIMTEIILMITAYVIGMIPNAYFLRAFMDKERLGHVRSDQVGAYYILTHIKEPPFYMTLLLDLVKGAGIVLLAQWLSDFSSLPAVLILITLIARNFNVIIGIRNGLGITIILGGLIIYTPLIVLIYAVVVPIFYFAIHDLDTALALSTVSMPIALGLMHDSLLTLLMGILMVMAVFVHKSIYIRAAAFRTKHRDYTRDNPFI